MTDTTGIDMEALTTAPHHTAPLEGDGIPDENQSHFCRSCEEPLSALYCGNCGQKNDDFRRPLLKLGMEAVAALTALENRIWRTWLNLIAKPGRVPRGFADGERTRWSSPIRVYIFMSILLFGYMDFTDTQFVAMDIDVESVNGENQLTFQPLFFVRESTVAAINADKDFALIRETLAQEDGFNVDFDWGEVAAEDRFSDIPPDVREDLERQMDTTRDQLSDLEDQLGIDLSDAKDSLPGAIPDGESDESEVVEINGEQVPSREAASFIADYARNPAIVNNILNVWLPRVVFLMMPISMLIGALFIRGRKRLGLFRRRDPDAQPALLYDHAVHAAYIHAVAYLLVFLSIVFAQVTGSGIAAQISFIYLLIYLPISLRRMFRRGWIKTFWTSYAVGFIYFLVITTVMTILIATGIEEHMERQRALLSSL